MIPRSSAYKLLDEYRAGDRTVLTGSAPKERKCEPKKLFSEQFFIMNVSCSMIIFTILIWIRNWVSTFEKMKWIEKKAYIIIIICCYCGIYTSSKKKDSCDTQTYKEERYCIVRCRYALLWILTSVWHSYWNFLGLLKDLTYSCLLWGGVAGMSFRLKNSKHFSHDPSANSYDIRLVSLDRQPYNIITYMDLLLFW